MSKRKQAHDGKGSRVPAWRARAGPAPSLPKETEKDFTQRVIDYLKLTGWKVYHSTAPGAAMWKPRGFPDIVAVRERVAFLELKMPGRTMSEYQEEWADALQHVDSEIGQRCICAPPRAVIYRCVYPEDWGWIERTFR